jgi:hypothetical protein
MYSYIYRDASYFTEFRDFILENRDMAGSGRLDAASNKEP